MMAYMDSGFKSSLQSTKDCLEMKRCLKESDIPEWMTEVKTILIRKYLSREPPRHLSADYVSLKILTTQIREVFSYYLQISQGLFPEEQKRYHRIRRKTDDLLFIDQHPLGEQNTMGK